MPFHSHWRLSEPPRRAGLRCPGCSRDNPIELCVGGVPDLSHAPLRDEAGHVVVADRGAELRAMSCWGRESTHSTPKRSPAPPSDANRPRDPALQRLLGGSGPPDGLGGVVWSRHRTLLPCGACSIETDPSIAGAVVSNQKGALATGTDAGTASARADVRTSLRSGCTLIPTTANDTSLWNSRRRSSAEDKIVDSRRLDQLSYGTHSPV